MMFFGMLFSLGPSLMWKNIFGTINEALGRSDNNLMVIVWSLVDGPGRALHGFLQDFFQEKIPRPAWIVLPVCMMLLGNLTLIYVGPQTLWFTHIAAAFSTSAVFGITTSLHPLYWGAQYTGLNLGVMLMAPGIGGTTLTYIATQFIETYPNTPSGLCVGMDCFITPLMIASVVISLSVVLFVFLTVFHARYFKGR